MTVSLDVLDDGFDALRLLYDGAAPIRDLRRVGCPLHFAFMSHHRNLQPSAGWNCKLHILENDERCETRVIIVHHLYAEEPLRAWLLTSFWSPSVVLFFQLPDSTSRSKVWGRPLQGQRAEG